MSTSLPDEEALLDQVGPALSRLRRSASDHRRVLRNLVLTVIAEAPGEITVGGVAEEMGVFQPVASRTVAACIADGLVRRLASQEDGRRSLLELTDSGEAERVRLARQQRGAFEQITRTWSRDDRLAFARFLVRYTEDGGKWLREHRDSRDD